MIAASKIKGFDELCQLVTHLKGKGKRIVQCHGIFDIIHPGIVRHVESASKQGDILVATVIRDKDVRKGPNYPIFSEKLRAENIASIGCVNYVAVVDDSVPSGCVKALKPDVFARGQDYKDRDQRVSRRIEDEEEALKVAGCKIHHTPGAVFSSTSIINQFLDVYPEKTRHYLSNFKRKYCAADIIRLLEGLRKLKVLIIGDAIIDEYHYCEPMGKSSKEHLVVSRYISDECFAGGTLAVANHVSGICQNVHLVSLLGAGDSREDFILSRLRSNVKRKFFYRQDASTIVKRRFVNQYLGQKLFEVCYLKKDEMPSRMENQILDYLMRLIPRFDLVMVCDFGHGLATKRLIHLVERKANVLAVNVQTNGANAGFNMVTKYHRVNFACLDETEVRLACQDRNGQITRLAKAVAKSTNADYVIVTEGKHGSIGVNSSGRLYRTPAFSSTVVDRIGAGDAFFSFTAPCFAKKLPLDVVSFVGNVVGAMAVQIVCNRERIEPEKLFDFVGTLLR
jgi:bifunctional ADP-heptose synthase (sugar kinase/adenylyltransferase)